MNNILFKTIMLKGDKGDPGADGAEITSIEKTASVGLIDTWTITLSTGETQTFEIKNGENAQLYEIPQGSIIAYDSTPETITETSDNSNTLQIEDVNGINKIKITGITKQNSLTGDITWNQLFPNGNFGNGVNNWKIYNTSLGTLTASVNIGTITYNSTSTGGYACGLTLNGYSIPIETSHKYFIQTDVKADFETSIAIEIGTGINNSDRNLTLNNWQRVTWIAQRPSWTTATTVIIKPTLSTIINGSTLQFKNLQFIDLTMLFGAETADYIYNLEINEPGAGVAYFKNFFPNDFYPYNAGTVTKLPSPDFPQRVNGIGELQQDETYTINLTVEDTANNTTYNLTAAGLTAPVYAGDVIDILNGTITRVNGVLNKNIGTMNSSEDFPGWINCGIRALIGGGINQNYTNPTVYCSVGNNFSINTSGQSNDTIFFPKTTYGGLTQSQWIANYSNLNVVFVFPLAEPATEPVTITGDITAIKNIIGNEITITAPADVQTLQCEFLQDTGTPDGYETFDAHWDTEITPGSTWAPETRAVYDELYFKNGDEIITGDNVDNPAPLLSGYCTTTYYRVVMQLPKRLTENQTVTVERLSGMTIYTSAGSSYVAVGSYDIGVRIVRELNQLIITFTPATSDPDRGGFCAITGQFKITITEEA